MPERRKVHCFEDLIVWQTGIELVKEVYRITTEGDFSKDFGLKDQLRRASVSVPTNIAEGFELTSRKEYLRHLNIAKGSAGEVRSLLRVAWEVGYLEDCQYRDLDRAVRKLSGYLFNHMKSIRNAASKSARSKQSSVENQLLLPLFPSSPLPLSFPFPLFLSTLPLFPSSPFTLFPLSPFYPFPLLPSYPFPV